MIASCNFLEIGLFNSSNSFWVNEKIPSGDSNIDVRSPCFSAPNLTGSNDETSWRITSTTCFFRSNVPNSWLQSIKAFDIDDFILKFAPALQEDYSTLFWNPTSTVNTSLEHISVKFDSSKEIGGENLAIFLTSESIIKTLIDHNSQVTH